MRYAEAPRSNRENPRSAQAGRRSGQRQQGEDRRRRRAVETTGLEWKPNPFDEYALEAALRLTENGKAPKARLGEVVVVTFGPKETEQTLRAALATGADRAIRVDVTDDQLDGAPRGPRAEGPRRREKPDLVLMGKQAVDGDSNQVGQLLAELLDWPMATFAADHPEEERARSSSAARSTAAWRAAGEAPRGGHGRSAHRRPHSVYSLTEARLQVQRRRPLRGAAGDHGGEEEAAPRGEARRPHRRRWTPHDPSYKFERPEQRNAGVKVKDVTELVERLADEAKVI